MIPVSVAALARVLDAELTGGPSAAAVEVAEVSGIAVDSRLVQPGSLFVALPGARVDGHDYVAAAFAAGAVAAVTARPVPGAGGPCLVTADPLLALGRVGRDQVDRARAGELRVAAMTGSQGKTSTKDLLAQVLETSGPTVSPHGNFNNEVGLPLTVARIGTDTRHLVAEMGARGVGHIAYLCTIAPPDVGIVLNVGSAHLSEFGSADGIAAAKGELVEALPPDGVAVLNADDHRVWGMRSRTRARVVGFALSGPPPGEGVWADRVMLGPDGCVSFRLHTIEAEPPVEVQLQVAGRHQVGNALAAAAAAASLGVGWPDIAAALSGARPRSRWRMEMHRRPGGGLVVNDAYNANPESMRAALDTVVDLARAAGGVSTWAVLGDMLELGAGAERDHVALGRYAAERGVDHLVLIGEFADAMAAGAVAGGTVPTVVRDREEAVEVVRAGLGATDVVLVKASRGLALETVAMRLQEADADRPTGDCT